MAVNAIPVGQLTTGHSQLPDETVVFSGRLQFADNVGGFDEHIFFSTPFSYDPRLGNLLLEVKNLSGTRNSPVAPGAPEPSFAAVYSTGFPARQLIGAPANAQTGTIVDSYGGLLTQFTFTAIPEPSALWIAVAGSTLILRKFQTKRRAKRDQHVDD